MLKRYKPKTSIEEFVGNFNNEGEFNYSIHISTDFRFIYFSNPKCACTTIKASLNMSCGSALGQDITYHDRAEIHDRDHNILITPHQFGYDNFIRALSDPSYYKFCFIREPVQRLASAFGNKLTWESESLVGLNQMLRRPDSTQITFPEFIATLGADEKLRDIDEHWRLQRKQVCYDLVTFDQIGLFEDFHVVLAIILKRVFGARVKSTIFDARQHFPEKDSNSGGLAASLTAAERGLIRRLYQADLDLFAALRRVRAGAFVRKSEAAETIAQTAITS